jgi:hypothetical protein
MIDDVAANILSPKPIAFEFFSKPENKTTQLINSSNDFFIEGSNRWYQYDFTEPVYLLEIKVDASGYESWNQFEIEVFHSDGTTHVEKVSVDNDTVHLSLGKLCRGFRFRPDKKYYHKTAINRVVATGYSLQEFHSFEWEIKKLVQRDAEVSKKEQELIDAEASRESALGEVRNLQSQVSKHELRKTELEEKIVSLEQQVKKSESDKKDLDSEIITLQEERRSIQSEIASNEKTFSELTVKLRLFPSEIAGFVEQGNRNIQSYIWIGLPFAAIFVAILWSLFFSAIDLTQIWKLENDVDVWTIFLTRIPFVIIAFALLEASGFIVGRLIFEIVKINRQRLEFSKLSIVAKDVTTASSIHLEMSDEEKFQEETKIKMGLLQEHMKSQSNEEFKYQGSAISSAIVGLAGKMLGKNA